MLGVIDARDHEELETALKQLGGGLSGKIAEVRGDLLDLLSDLEAGLDFVEEDIEFVERADLIARLNAAAETIGRLSTQAESRMQSTGRLRVVLAGLPNAGKSFLFNALVGDEAAIVSDIKGTTRDVLYAAADWYGLALELYDTAGWESAPTELMREADQRRHEHSTNADLLLYCIASDVSADEAGINRQLLAEFDARQVPLVLVRTKSDLPSLPAFPNEETPAVRVSALTGEGLPELQAEIARRMASASGRSRQLIGTTAARCRESLTSAAESLREAVGAATLCAGDELIAVELHQALEHLGRILGSVYTDDILDRIFSKFCIGK